MKTIDLHIIDIVQNSIRAKADNIHIYFNEYDNKVGFKIIDNGCGMSKELLEKVKTSLHSTRKERNIGLGLALLSFHVKQTGGYIDVDSELGKGTKVEVEFVKDHIDCQPVGDIPSCISSFICQYSNINFIFTYSSKNDKFEISTSEIKEVFGDVELNNASIISSLSNLIKESMQS